MTNSPTILFDPDTYLWLTIAILAILTLTVAWWLRRRRRRLPALLPAPPLPPSSVSSSRQGIGDPGTSSLFLLPVQVSVVFLVPHAFFFSF